MKRLVDYSSDSSDSSQQPPTKKKLPALPPSLTLPTPIDNPALHQGRIRSSPHINGQYAAYIYIPLVVEPKSRLGKLLGRVVKAAKEVVPTLHPIGVVEDGVGDGEGEELHISLSRPIYLFAHQRDDLKRAVKTLAKSHPPFTASFATFLELTNDERTRTFLTAEIGAGHAEMRAMSEALTPTLQSMRQKEFYSIPRFHASIGWALLDRPDSKVSCTLDVKDASNSSSSSAETSPTPNPAPVPTDPPTSSLACTTETPTPTPQFITIPHLPPTLVPLLNTTYSKELARIGTFEAEEVRVRIGKEEWGWGLSG
ncbi:hypothetical protein JAAARDRAFT_203423 [Jaapia argillacea MUCL 33604]|uniref:U6 snRNA phosphodiesterase 1 n=1 Tax=Jaapia argillacea MUCL 33604 TaxID=933084 RepID=A0A067QI18_9AGAM|nr:hypothetical protein JAAARDRAFT_203423 [Jaapia argillacea MUCL 33604]